MSFISRLSQHMSKSKIFIILLFTGLLIFTRFYNLDFTARFTEDESKDLVGIHQIFVDKKLTLVGSTNEQGTKVFSSLTFYMLLPAAIMGGFDPASPAYGTAFWGILTAILIVCLTKLLNPKLTVLVAALTLAWFPLLETSRWAWNPNLIPFWIALALVFYQKKGNLFKFLSGLSLGAAVHNHYYAIFAVGSFIFAIGLYSLIKKRFRELLLMCAGLVLTFIPFVIFDLRHPPGIFLAGFLKQGENFQSALGLSQIVLRTFVNIKSLLLLYTQAIWLSVAVGLSALFLLFYDIRKRSLSLIYFVPWISQLLAISLAPEFFPHYLIPGLIFFLAWVIYSRKRAGRFLSFAVILLMLLGGLLSIFHQLTNSTSVPPIPIVRSISEVLKNETGSKNLKNVNLAVLASGDHTTSGKKYRDIFLVQNNYHLLVWGDYLRTDNLFVISTSSEETVRKDPAVEMHYFRKGKLAGVWRIPNSDWSVYLFNRNPL